MSRVVNSLHPVSDGAKECADCPAASAAFSLGLNPMSQEGIDPVFI
jgi:hypothetical protein